MAKSFPAFGTRVYFAASGSGTADDPYSPIWIDTGSPSASFQMFGEGAYFAAASGSGTPGNPYIPLVNISAVGMIELEDGSGAIEIESGLGTIGLE